MINSSGIFALLATRAQHTLPTVTGQWVWENGIGFWNDQVLGSKVRIHGISVRETLMEAMLQQEYTAAQGTTMLLKY